MSSFEDHQEMIDDQYLMESIEDDQKEDQKKDRKRAGHQDQSDEDQ